MESTMNRVIEISKRAWNFYCTCGFAETTRVASRRIRGGLGLPSAKQKADDAHHKAVDTSFDGYLGTDTGGTLHLDRLNIVGDNRSIGVGYLGSDPVWVEKAISCLPLDYSQFTFIDLGSGKGRALLIARKYPFRRIVGIEFAEELHQVALRNMSIVHDARVELVHGDVATFEIPAEPLVVYLYNPFRPPLAGRIAEKLADSWRRRRRPIYVVYAYPAHLRDWLDAGWLQTQSNSDFVVLLPTDRTVP